MTIIEKRKQIKKNNIIKIIREMPEVSRYVLKKATKYSMTTILNSVTALIEEGLITEEESTQKSVGRTPVYLNVNPDGKYFIGVEFNAEALKVVIMNFALELTYSEQYKIPKNVNTQGILELIKNAIEIALNRIDNHERVEGIGIGIPGYVDKKKGIALEYSYFSEWKNVKIKEILEKAFGYEVHIDNNINALAYNYRIQHKEKANFVIVSMQYGVRLGIVLDGEIFIGNNGNAGEIGHTKVIGGHRECSCGNTGCLDSEISYVAIEKKVHEYLMEGRLASIAKCMTEENNVFKMAMLGETIRQGDKEAEALLHNITGFLGRKLSTVISVIDIEDIIILNICDLDNEKFAEEVYNTIKVNTIGTTFETVSVACEVVDSFSAAKGAAIMIQEEKYGYIKET